MVTFSPRGRELIVVWAHSTPIHHTGVMRIRMEVVIDDRWEATRQPVGAQRRILSILEIYTSYASYIVSS